MTNSTMEAWKLITSVFLIVCRQYLLQVSLVVVAVGNIDDRFRSTTALFGAKISN
jgi:hypothetical protein